MFAPIIPVAPGRLSTITCCFHDSLRFWPTIRETMSVPPPGGKPTIKRMVLVGYCWALAALTRPAARIMDHLMQVMGISIATTVEEILPFTVHGWLFRPSSDGPRRFFL